jgi:hypothetical protein
VSTVREGRKNKMILKSFSRIWNVNIFTMSKELDDILNSIEAETTKMFHDYVVMGTAGVLIDENGVRQLTLEEIEELKTKEK